MDEKENKLIQEILDEAEELYGEDTAMLWVCSCGGREFFLHATGEIQCSSCGYANEGIAFCYSSEDTEGKEVFTRPVDATASEAIKINYDELLDDEKIH